MVHLPQPGFAGKLHKQVWNPFPFGLRWAPLGCCGVRQMNEASAHICLRIGRVVVTTQGDESGCQSVLIKHKRAQCSSNTRERSAHQTQESRNSLVNVSPVVRNGYLCSVQGFAVHASSHCVCSRVWGIVSALCAPTTRIFCVMSQDVF